MYGASSMEELAAAWRIMVCAGKGSFRAHFAAAISVPPMYLGRCCVALHWPYSILSGIASYGRAILSSMTAMRHSCSREGLL